MTRNTKSVAKTAPKLCIIPGCGTPVQARGLCHNCYVKARTQINSKKTSGKRLIEAGMLLPSRRGQRPELAPFEKQLAAVMSK